MQTLSHDTLNQKGKLTQKREKKNAPLQNVQSEDSLNSQSMTVAYKDLAANIILQAILDKKSLAKGKLIHTVYKEEIEAFADSKWLENLSYLLDIDPSRIRKHLKSITIPDSQSKHEALINRKRSETVNE